MPLNTVPGKHVKESDTRRAIAKAKPTSSDHDDDFDGDESDFSFDYARTMAEVAQHMASRQATVEPAATRIDTSNPLVELFSAARIAQGDRPHYNAYGDFAGRGPKIDPASVRTMNIADMFVTLAGGGTSSSRPSLLGTLAGRTLSVPTVIMEASRVAQAGARILVAKETEGRPVPVIGADPNGNPEPRTELVFENQVKSFVVTDPCEFVAVPDGTDLADSPLPIFTATADLDTMPSYGIRIPVSRRDTKNFESGFLESAVLQSVALGLARLADKVLLNAIANSSPATFSLGAAADSGLEFHELRAMIGTAGAGALVAQDGTLRAAGVLAELTGDTADTLVGSFTRAAVALHERVALTAKRERNGDVTFTVWCSAEALLPKPDAFWKVVA